MVERSTSKLALVIDGFWGDLETVRLNYLRRFIQSRDIGPASFNDDSSPDTRLTSNQKVAVSAQILPGSNLDWYFLILQLYGSVKSELKSSEAWERFRAAPRETQDRIWRGLTKVRIHIVDPRPYRISGERLIERALRVRNARSFLRERVTAGQPTAIRLSEQLQMYTAGRILSDSMAGRVHTLSKVLRDPWERMWVVGDQDDLGDLLDLAQFDSNSKAIVRRVSIWAAKSGAAFHMAMDSFLEGDDARTHRFFTATQVRVRMRARILDSHAFDEGDQKSLELLELARDRIDDRLGDLGSRHLMIRPRPYIAIDSKESFMVQAADLAAGIVSKTLEIENLVTVVSRLEYVTYNGHRISVSNAEEELRKLRN